MTTRTSAHVSSGDEEGALACYEQALARLGGLGDAAGEESVRAAVASLGHWRAAADEPVARWRRGLEAAARPKRRRKAATRKRSAG